MKFAVEMGDDICALCFAIGIFAKDNSYFNIWCINTALTSMLYMYFGYIFKQGVFEKLATPLATGICFIVYVILLCVSMKFYPRSTINFHTCEYYNIFICLGLSFSGIILIKNLADFITLKYKYKLLSSFGQNTIVIYLASGTFNIIALKLLNEIFNQNDSSILICILAAIFSCTIGYVISIICKKYCPFLLGETRH